MPSSSPLNEQERADLVAWLDGELEGEAARALERKLSLDPAARDEADALRKTWELLDYLPRPEPSASFTHRTLSRLAPAQAARPRPTVWQRWRRPVLGAGWAAALVAAAVGGYAGYNRLAPPHEPGERDLVRDLRIIENKRYYDAVEDFDFLRALDQPDLFGDDGPGAGG